jgi:4-hydroxy-tetrahydrodipicolinate synthase
MTTPFDDGGEIDAAAVRAQVRWLLDRGVHGLAAGDSTGEGHTLDADELRRLVATLVEAADGRVPVIVGIIVDSTRDAIRRGQALADLGVAALFRPDDEAMLAHFRAICEATGQKVIIYNVVPWSYLAPDLLLRIMRELPGVIGVKQSAGDLKLVADLLLGAREGDHIFSAVDALLYPSFILGAHGTIAALPTAAPGPCTALWDAVQRDDHRRAHELHRRLLRLVECAGRRQPAGLRQARADAAGLSGGPAARTHAGGKPGPAARDRGGAGSAGRWRLSESRVT